MKIYNLKQKQSLSLDMKIRMSRRRIREFYEHFSGNVYVSFSGGKDSTVMLHLIRSLYPDIPAVFVDTGLEYPEIKEFVKEIEDVTWLRPQILFSQVLEDYGYPIVSKDVAKDISRYRNTNSLAQKQYRLHGRIKDGKKQTRGVIPKKWQFLINAPFKISDRCCEVMKKNPFKKFEKETKLKPFIGMMASESNARKMAYLHNGCNIFEGKAKSMPLSFWLEKDIWDYIKKFGLSYSKIYDMGEDRTGCMFCMFGAHLEKQPNRFQRMARIHPKLYDYCLNKLGLKDVLDYIKVSYQPNKEL